VPVKRVGMVPVCAAAVAITVSKVWLRVGAGPAVRWSMRGARAAIGPTIASPRYDFARAVAAVGARWPFNATCLEQGIALVLLLKWSGVPARLTIGVARSGAALNGHACVESRGRVLLGGAQMEGLLPLTSLSCRG
jgi:hypothetical protein